MLKKDLEQEKYGSFIYGRFLNPIYGIKNKELIYNYQKQAIKKETMYSKKLINETNEHSNILKNFILSRGLYFPKYLKSLETITILQNDSIKNFCNCILENYTIQKKEELTRDCENIFCYWKTRFAVKNKPININSIIGLYNFKITKNNIIEEDV